MSGEIVQLATHMTPTGALKTLHNDLQREAKMPAALQAVPLIGQGKLGMRIEPAPKDPRIPAQLEWVWCVMESYVTDGRVVREEVKRTGLKATYAEAASEMKAAFDSFKNERG